MIVASLADWRCERGALCENLSPQGETKPSEAARVGVFLSGNRPPTIEYIIRIFDIDPAKDFVDHPSYRPSVCVGPPAGELWDTYPCVLQLTAAKAEIIWGLLAAYVSGNRNELTKTRDVLRANDLGDWFLSLELIREEKVMRKICQIKPKRPFANGNTARITEDYPHYR